MSNIQNAIQTLVELSGPTAGIRQALLKQGYDKAEIEEALPKQVRQGFNAQFYDWLAESERSTEEVEEFVKEHGTANSVKHMSHYQNIADLARRIWNA